MSALQWVRWFPNNWVASPYVRRMDAEQAGIYIQLLNEQAIAHDGVAKGDLDHFRSTYRASSASQVQYVLEMCFKWDAELEGWYNEKMRAELGLAHDRAAAGKKGATVRWSGDTKPPRETGPAKLPNYTPEYEELWAEARGRGSKKKAFDQYKRHVPSVIEHADLLAAWCNYVDSVSEDKFIKHLERWIRDQAWTSVEHAPPVDPYISALSLNRKGL